MNSYYVYATELNDDVSRSSPWPYSSKCGFVDGHELLSCCEILGRNATSRVHIFVGDDAKEIFLNWNINNRKSNTGAKNHETI